MAAIRVQVPSYNTYIDFPEGTSPDVIQSAMEQNFPTKSEWRQKPGTEGRDVAEMQREFIAKEGTDKTRLKEGAKGIGRAVMPYVRPVMEGGGAVLGGMAGIPAAPATMGLSSVGGAGLGYAMGAKGADVLESLTGANSRPQPATIAGQGLQSLADIGTGAAFEMGGQAAIPAIKGLASLTGKIAKPIAGRLSGTGVAAIDESIKSGMTPTTSLNPLKSTTTYDKALRGQIKGEDIVDSARTALNRLKENRTTAYQSDLNQVSGNMTPIDTRPIKAEVAGLMNRYNVKIDPVTGQLDTSRIAMGKTGRNDIKEIIETVSSWGSKQGDNTAVGLDTLKRQLDDFYSDSSQARQFVSQIRNSVKDTIVKAVPQYDEMTKGYTEATKIIKDVEAGLMLRKQGMSGRVVADQTLRRLMSSMRDNFALRKELVDVLGKEGGEDLGAAIAGYTQNSVVPMGLAGTGPAILGSAALAKFFDPAFASVIVASSPRVQGEFFRMLGKGMKTAKAIGTTNQKNIIRQSIIQATQPQGATQ